MTSITQGIVVLLWFAAVVGNANDLPTTSVGMPGRIQDLILPGPLLEVIPMERDAPLIVRIVQSMAHGPEQHRYAIEYYGLEPGAYNLADYLQQPDGTAAAIPAIPVTVTSQFGTGQVLPNALKSKTTPRLGGYRHWLLAAGIVWVAGLLAILFVGRQQRKAAAETAKPQSLADRLQPLVKRAMEGQLAGAEQAHLEQMLLTYWRGKLDLNDADASDAMVQLRNHEVAGQLLRQLEAWLHMPADRRTAVDLAELLKPYQNVRDESQAVHSSGASTT